MLIAAHAAAMAWAGSWALAMASRGSRTGDVAGIIGVVAFLVGTAIAVLLGIAAFSVWKAFRWRWWIEAAAVAAPAWWYVAWFSQTHWKIWTWTAPGAPPPRA